MEEDRLHQVVPISSPWRTFLLEAVAKVRQSLFIVCPYIKEEIVIALKEALLSREPEAATPVQVRVLTRVLPEELLNGSSDITAFQQLLSWSTELAGSHVDLRAVDNVHAKVWIFDTDLVIVGSGNATLSGLDENLEYGLAVSDPQLVARILQDWENWWEQAGLVAEDQLEQLRLWLQRESVALRQVEVAFEERRKEIERTIGPVPRIGRRLSLRTYVRRVERPAMQVSPGHQLAESSPSYAKPVASPETVVVSASYLLQALSWVFPHVTTDLPLATFLKMTWKGDHLQCTWADGKRLSLAIIPGHDRELGRNWAVTIDIRKAVLIERALHDILALVSDDEVILLLVIQGVRCRLHITTSGSTIDLEKEGITATLTSPPPPFPVLQGPISHITVEHTLLMEMLAQVEQRCSPQPSVIEIRLATPNATAKVIFSVGPLESPIMFPVHGSDSVLVGPSISLRLDYAAFEQALAGAQGNVVAWKFSIDRNAEAVQLLPETEDEVVRGWKHHFWHVEE